MRRKYFDDPYGPGGSSDLDYKGWGGAGYISRPLEYNHGGVGGTYNGDGPGLSHSSLSVSGYSSYQWRWTPPYIPGTSTPDNAHFPAPPLYVLGRIGGSLQFRPQSQSLLGLVGSASIADGWGYSESISTVPDYAPKNAADSEHRKVLGPASAAGANVEVRLSPSLSTDLSGVSFGGKAYTLAGVNESVFPIHLSQPDILGRPDVLGDGKNQYVYDSQPTGQLNVAAQILVDGGGQSDADWLLPSVDWAVLAQIAGQRIYSKVASGNLIQPHTLGSNPSADPPPGTPYPDGNIIYLGLPVSNNDFGTHYLYLQVHDANSESAHFQTFYTGLAKNHGIEPGLSPDNYPNWYYYYNQVYPVTGSDNRTYAPGSPSHTDSDVNSSGYRYSNVYIEDDSYTYPQCRVFGFDCSKSGGFLRYLGHLEVKGIHSFTSVCAHEQGHATAWLTNVDNPKDDDPSTGTSFDGDRIADIWESYHHMNHHDSYTAKYAYGFTDSEGNLPGGDTPDNETVADIPALNELLNHKDLWQQDWADGGIQKGMLYFNPSNFFWKFYPSEPSSVSFPTDAAGNPLPYYKVSTVNDLQQLYPGTTIATSWAAIEGSCPP